MDSSIFNRTELLVGTEGMERLAAARVILFGVGGVGSWCAEGLVRSGVGHLTLVDGDVVVPSNINRQLMATTATVGRVKVDALKEHLLEVNPAADIDARRELFSHDTVEGFGLENYDYVVDAIDSLQHKLELILRCTQKTVPFGFYSSMGAALKMDPTQIRVSEFWEVDGCPLAATLRRRMRRQKRFPGHKFKCVWSPEVIRAGGGEQVAGSGEREPNGSMMHVTAIMGLTLAGLIIQDITR
ncbi:MAG: tRNA threonylcarbamoyladenosine dehydratase [Bacteroidales bacterium]|nr:tRNA threonylcarbamoyladenosine dehydratase [Bacteroidales bacterium]